MSESPRGRIPALVLALACLAGCDPILNLRPASAAAPEAIASTAVAADRAYREEDWAKAEDGYRRLTQLAPADAEHWFRLGNVYAQTDRPGDAVRMYGEALSRDTSHTGAWHNLGMTQLRLATRSFENLEARTADPDPTHGRARRFVDAIESALAAEQTDDDSATDMTP